MRSRVAVNVSFLLLLIPVRNIYLRGLLICRVLGRRVARDEPTLPSILRLLISYVIESGLHLRLTKLVRAVRGRAFEGGFMYRNILLVFLRLEHLDARLRGPIFHLLNGRVVRRLSENFQRCGDLNLPRFSFAKVGSRDGHDDNYGRLRDVLCVDRALLFLDSCDNYNPRASADCYV